MWGGGGKRGKWQKGAHQNGKNGGGTEASRKKARAQLKQCLDADDLDGALTAAEQMGGAPPGGGKSESTATLERLLELAAKSGGPVQYCQALAVCAEANIQMEVPTFSKLLVILTARIPCPAGMVRLTLNMALPPTGEVVPLVPKDATADAQQECFEDGEPANLREAASSSALADVSLLPLLRLSEGPGVPPVAAGIYDALRCHEALPLELARGPVGERPVYRRRPNADGLGPYLYFWREAASPNGAWCLAAELGARATDLCGWHGNGAAQLPPVDGWQFYVEGRWQESSCAFLRDEAPSASSPSAAVASSPSSAEKEKEGEAAERAREALEAVDPASLRGWVKGRDEKTAAYFGHFCALLHIEFLVELGSMQRRLRRPVDDLKRFGWTLDGLTVGQVQGRVQAPKKSSGGLPGKTETGTVRVSFALGPGPRATFLRMRNGDSVLLSRTNPLRDLVAEGTVAEAPVDEDGAVGAPSSRVVLSLDGCEHFSTPEASRGMWRLDKAVNRTAYERQFGALIKLANAKDGKRCPLWELLPLSDVGTENVDAWAERMKAAVDERQRAKLEGNDALHKNGSNRIGAPMLSAASQRLVLLAAEQPEVQGGARTMRMALAEVRESPDLNPSQREAIAAAMSQRMALIQGPPGTGKTHVSVQLLESLCRKLWCWPLLASSDSNVAVDNIAEGLLKRGVKVVRVGQPEKVRAHLDEITLETIMRKRRAEQREREAKWAAEGRKADASLNPDDEKWRRMEDYEAKLKILKDAEVICCTTITSGSMLLDSFKFGAILIDEVAQATEPSAIVPIVLRGAERLILVGDHCQLPPSVCALEAEMRGLSLSLFGRWAAQGVDPHFLDTQFRMHPMIVDFSAKRFYHGRLKSGVTASQRPAPSGFPWPKNGCGIAFVHRDRPEMMDGDSRSNASEADCVSDILANVLVAKELSVLQVGVVTPYAAQVRALRRKLAAELPRKLRGHDVDLSGGVAGMQGIRALEVASVDAFQGREKELIIFSAVRSNEGGRVGFLADWRRLNVMITRARRGLIVVGNMNTLRCDPTWRSWLEWAEEEGLIVRNLNGDARRRAERDGTATAAAEAALEAGEAREQEGGNDLDAVGSELERQLRRRGAVRQDVPEDVVRPTERPTFMFREEFDESGNGPPEAATPRRAARVVEEEARVAAKFAAMEDMSVSAVKEPKAEQMSPLMKGVLVVLIGALAFNLYLKPVVVALFGESA